LELILNETNHAIFEAGSMEKELQKQVVTLPMGGIPSCHSGRCGGIDTGPINHSVPMKHDLHRSRTTDKTNLRQLFVNH
jgi:hypothetical protein